MLSAVGHKLDVIYEHLLLSNSVLGDGVHSNFTASSLCPLPKKDPTYINNESFNY